MDTTGAPQIIEHLNKSLAFTPFDTKWIPTTAKFVLFGQTPGAKGVLQIFEIDKTEMKLNHDNEQPEGIKCATFGASRAGATEVSFGDFGGNLKIFDIEKQKVSYSVTAHKGITNAIDGVGGSDIGYGAPEIVTGGRDGCVRVWDQRQKAPVLALEPADKESIVPDCWAVSFGNSFNSDERCIAAGYDNGDVKLFDLRKNSLIFDTNIKNGVCGIEFDRKDIIMNKLGVTTLEGKFHIYDLRTYHHEHEYAGLQQTGPKGTLWGIKHLPQNRDLFAVQAGDGSLNIYKYNYPSQRSIDAGDGKQRGVVGTVELLNTKEIATQPIVSLDWNRDKLGLGVTSSLDQKCSVVVVTKLNNY